MENEKEQKEENKNTKKKSKLTFSKVFWSVIITGIIVYVVLEAVFYKNVTKNSPTENIQNIQQTLIKISPEVFKVISKLDKESKEEITNIIKKNMDILYAPVYKRVDDYVNFHYTLKGDYTELFAGVSNNFDKYLQNHIFGKDFKERLKQQIQITNNQILQVLINKSKEFKKELKNMGYSQKEINFLVNKIMKFSIEDTKKRYLQTTDNLFRAGGVGAGIVGGAMIGMKMATKQTAKILAKKLLAKLAIKTTAKVASASAGAATGAAEGSILGPLGAVGGGLVGGIIGWFATDMIVIKVDEYLHKKEFKEEIIQMINKHKQQTENNLITLYTSISNKIFEENEKRLKELKNKKIKDIILNQ